MTPRRGPPRTLDGRYFVVRGRLWRLSDPSLGDERRGQLVKQLVSARRAIRSAAGNADALAGARLLIDAAKRKLGERGPVWWDDDAPDYNRRRVRTTPYACWFAELPDDVRAASDA